MLASFPKKIANLVGQDPASWVG